MGAVQYGSLPGQIIAIPPVFARSVVKAGGFLPKIKALAFSNKK